MSLLIAYVRKRGLNSHLQMKVKKYFQYCLEERMEDEEAAELLIQQLSTSLKCEVLTDINFKILMQHKVFALNFSRAFLLKLAPYLKERRVMPEELIFA